MLLLLDTSSSFILHAFEVIFDRLLVSYKGLEVALTFTQWNTKCWLTWQTTAASVKAEHN